MRDTNHWQARGFGMIDLLATVSVASAQNIGPVLHFPLNDGTGASVVADTSGNEWALMVGSCPSSGPRTDPAGFVVESGTARYVVRDPNTLTLDQWHHVVGLALRVARNQATSTLPATDALIILKFSVGAICALGCPRAG